MKWQRARQSQNIDDRRGGRSAARAGGVGIGGLAIALIAGWFLGVNPAEILSLLGGVQGS
ncbi:MAG: neutral zinc metallopeptidase, partial [Xanthomonadales bacterium]|nr:neutral zinc metallopeptidase [Xanthomonadales bacterium]